MKNRLNRGLLASIIIIAAMALYILVGERFKDSEYPDVLKGKGDATEFTIKKAGSSMRLYKKDGAWVINDEAFPADENIVKNIETDLKGIKISGSISKGDFPERYDLTPEKAVEVTATFSDKSVKKILIGKKGSTSRHHYIALDSRPDIFLAAGNFDSLISRSVDDLRNREILKINPDDVQSFQIFRGYLSFNFYKKITEEKTKTDGKDQQDNKSQSETWICTGYESVKFDTDKVRALIAGFNPLRASSFANLDRAKLRGPIMTVKLMAGGKEHKVDIFEKGANGYPAEASGVKYLFTIDEELVKKLSLDNIESLKSPVK